MAFHTPVEVRVHLDLKLELVKISPPFHLRQSINKNVSKDVNHSMARISGACCPTQCGEHCFNVCACVGPGEGQWPALPLEIWSPSICLGGKHTNEEIIGVESFSVDKSFCQGEELGNRRFTRL